MTSIGQREEIPKDSAQVKNCAERFSGGHWTFPKRRKEVVRNSQLHIWRKLEFHRRTDGGTIQRNWSPNVIQEHQCCDSWNSEKERWQRYHTLQCGFIEHRTLVSHSSLSKSAEYLRSSLKLVWRVRSKDSESERVDFRKVRGKRKWAVTDECETARSNFFGANFKERKIHHLETDCENVFRSLKLWRKYPIYDSLWRCVILEKSLYWDELQNHSWRRWWFWRSNPSMQRIHTSSWKFRFQNLGNDSRTNFYWTSSSSSYHTISLHHRNWNSDTFHDNASANFLGSDMLRWELHLNDPDHNPTSSELLLERSVAKGSEPCCTKMEQSSIEESHAKQFEIQTNPVYIHSEEPILI